MITMPPSDSISDCEILNFSTEQLQPAYIFPQAVKDAYAQACISRDKNSNSLCCSHQNYISPLINPKNIKERLKLLC